MIENQIAQFPVNVDDMVERRIQLIDRVQDSHWKRALEMDDAGEDLSRLYSSLCGVFSPYTSRKEVDSQGRHVVKGRAGTAAVAFNRLADSFTQLYNAEREASHRKLGRFHAMCEQYNRLMTGELDEQLREERQKEREERRRGDKCGKLGREYDKFQYVKHMSGTPLDTRPYCGSEPEPPIMSKVSLLLACGVAKYANRLRDGALLRS